MGTSTGVFVCFRGKKCQFLDPKMKQRKRGRPPKKTIQPTIIEAGMLPVITKPMGIIGKHVELPGSYWPPRGQSAGELRTLYRHPEGCCELYGHDWS